VNFIKQLQADNLELNQRLHATQQGINDFKLWLINHSDGSSFEGVSMLNGLIRGAFPICGTIIEDIPTTNMSGITCKCEQHRQEAERNWLV